jgi:hypothetical protein
MSRRASVAKGTGVAVALLLCVRVAGSQEPAGKDGGRSGASQADAPPGERQEAANALQLEVKALQDELARLREQLTKVDQQLERLQSALRSAPPAGADASKGGPQTPSGCMPPYVLADDGIKRFRTECLSSPSCDRPFFIDGGGIKHFRDECMPPARESADDRCSPPYYLKEDGTKLFKIQCL